MIWAGLLRHLGLDYLSITFIAHRVRIADEAEALALRECRLLLPYGRWPA